MHPASRRVTAGIGSHLSVSNIWYAVIDRLSASVPAILMWLSSSISSNLYLSSALSLSKCILLSRVQAAHVRLSCWASLFGRREINWRDWVKGGDVERERWGEEEKDFFYALSSSLLAELRARSSHVHARSRRLPSICPHLPLSLRVFPLPLLISLTAFCTLNTFFFLPPISFCSLSSPLNSFISFCSLILMILPLSSRSVSVSLWVMQWALPGFVCLTALQELLLAHREHYSVDLLAAGVRRGQTKGGGVQE